MILESIFSALIFSGAGLLMLAFGYSRFIIPQRAPVVERLVPPLAFLVLVGLPFVAGWITGFSRWLIVPGVVVLAFVLGEIHRLAVRRRCRGFAPIEIEKPRLSLRKPVTTIDLAIARYEVPVPRIPAGRRLRIAHVSDLHLMGLLPLDYYLSVIDKLNEQKPDLVFATGDFVTDLEYAGQIAEIFAPLRTRYGCYATLGNHDFWRGPEPISSELRKAGLILLENTAARLDLDGCRLLIGGCDDPWAESAWSPPRLDAGELYLVLSHTPDNIYRLGRAGAAAVFSGHLHAGQVRVPWLGPFVLPSLYGRRFDHGHFVVEGTHLFVSAGVGSATPPFRVFCHPDLFIVDLVGR